MAGAADYFSRAAAMLAIDLADSAFIDTITSLTLPLPDCFRTVQQQPICRAVPHRVTIGASLRLPTVRFRDRDKTLRYTPVSAFTVDADINIGVWFGPANP